MARIERRPTPVVTEEEPAEDYLRAGFVFVTHPDLEGSRASVPEALLGHHAARGWVLADSSAPVAVEEPATTEASTDAADLSPQED